VATLAATRRFDLTDEWWARLAPLLPVATKPGRPSKWTKRQLIDGIRWRVRVGAPWRDVPDGWEGAWTPRLPGRISTPPGPAPGRTSRKNLRVESATERAASPLITRWDVRVAG
jgi:transposase